MAYKTVVDGVDFDKIICGTRPIKYVPSNSAKQQSYRERIGLYRSVEKKIVRKNLAQSLPEYITVLYWLKGMSHGGLARNLWKLGFWFEYNHVSKMMDDLNIPLREKPRKKMVA